MTYSKELLSNYKIVTNQMENVGSLDPSDSNVGTGIVGAPACGDVMKLQIKVGKNNVIEDAKFKTFGCGAALASSAFATKIIKNQSIQDAMQINNQLISQKLALPPVKRHCSLLAEEAIKAAISDYKNKCQCNDG